MKCKYCKTTLVSNSSVCPSCGKDNLKDDLKGLKIATLVIACVLMVSVLGSLVYYGVTGNTIFDLFHQTPETHKVSTPDGMVTVTDRELKKQMDTVVATMGDHKLTNRELQLYFWMAASAYSDDVDSTKPLSEQVYDKETGKTYEEVILEKALAAWQEVTLMSSAAKKAGFEMPKEYKEYLDGMKKEIEYYIETYKNYFTNPINNVDDYIQMLYGPGCDYKTYYEYSYNYYLGGIYWSMMMDELEVTDQELEDYFSKNETSLKEDYALPITKDSGKMVDLRLLTVAVVTKEVTDEQGNKTTEKDWEATMAAAKKLYETYMSGEKTEDAFIELVKKNSADTSTAASGGLYADLMPNYLTEVDVRHILIQPEGGTKDEKGNTVYTDEAWAKAYTEAEAILKEWLDGEKTEESFGALANKHSDDRGGQVTNGGLYVDIYVSQMVQEFEDWCFEPSRKTGDYGIVKTAYGYHIMYYVRADREGNDWAFDDARKEGDVTFVKNDDNYMVMYYVGSETAWVRYCRYGVQSEKAAAQLEQMLKDNAYTLKEAKIALAQLSTIK